MGVVREVPLLFSWCAILLCSSLVSLSSQNKISRPVLPGFETVCSAIRAPQPSGGQVPVSLIHPAILKTLVPLIVSVDQQKMLVTIRDKHEHAARFSEQVAKVAVPPAKVSKKAAMKQVSEAKRKLAAESKAEQLPVVKVTKRRKTSFTFTPAPRVKRMDMPDGAVFVSGALLYPHEFLIMCDCNGMQHLVYITGSRFVPGPRKEDPIHWFSRVVFVNKPGWYCSYVDIEQEIHDNTGRFHRVPSLHAAALKDIWWRSEGVVVPPASTQVCPYPSCLPPTH